MSFRPLNVLAFCCNLHIIRHFCSEFWGLKLHQILNFPGIPPRIPQRELTALPTPLAGGEGARCPLPKNPIPALGPSALGLRPPPPCEGKKFAPSKWIWIDATGANHCPTDCSRGLILFMQLALCLPVNGRRTVSHCLPTTTSACHRNRRCVSCRYRRLADRMRESTSWNWKTPVEKSTCPSPSKLSVTFHQCDTRYL